MAVVQRHIYMMCPRRCACLSGRVLPVSLVRVAAVWYNPRWARPYDRPFVTRPLGRPCVPSLSDSKAAVRGHILMMRHRRCACLSGPHKFPCCPVHAHAWAYLPEHVRGRGVALVWGCDGGDVGDDRPQFPFVGPRSAPLPSMMSWSCLLPLLCGHNVPASGEQEHPVLSPTGRVRPSPTNVSGWPPGLRNGTGNGTPTAAPAGILHT